MILSISCLPNFLQVSQESRVLLRSFVPPHLLLFTNAVNFHIFGNFCNCMQTWTYLCILVVYTPLKQKPEKVGNKLGKFTLFYYYCVSLFIGTVVSMESTWRSAPQIITTKCQACARESNRTLLFKRWIRSHSSLD